MTDAVFVRVLQEGGQVVMLFSEDVEGTRPAHIAVWKVDPAQVVPIARTMTDLAFEADTKLKPVGDTLKSELINRHRLTLTHRFAVMLSSLREDKLKTNGQLAQVLVDAALNEVFT